jgi:hypothetical protein
VCVGGRVCGGNRKILTKKKEMENIFAFFEFNLKGFFISSCSILNGLYHLCRFTINIKCTTNTVTYTHKNFAKKKKVNGMKVETTERIGGKFGVGSNKGINSHPSHHLTV